MTWRAWPKIHFGLGFVRRWLKVHFAAAHILLKFSLYRLDDQCTCFGFVLFAWSAAKGPWNVCTMISSTRSWEYILFWRLGRSARPSIIVLQPHSPIWLHMDAPCLSVWDWHMSRFALRTHNAFGVDEVTFGKIFGWHIDLQFRRWRPAYPNSGERCEVICRRCTVKARFSMNTCQPLHWSIICLPRPASCSLLSSLALLCSQSATCTVPSHSAVQDTRMNNTIFLGPSCNFNSRIGRGYLHWDSFLLQCSP